ncbi:MULTISPECIES: hypothetical protein [unclassified Bradyrhizobium]
MTIQPGKRIAKADRDDMARLALHIRKTCATQEEAHRVVSGMFRVSRTTARHLIVRGKHLTIQAEITKAAT